MGNSKSLWSKTFDEIKKKHDGAYAAIEEAITLEEHEKPVEAIEKYKEGIDLIDGALRVQVTCPQNPDFTWEKACIMIQKMKKTRAEVLSRITSIQPHTPVELGKIDSPPSYEEAVQDQKSPITYNDLAQALNHLQIENNMDMEAEVIYMYEGVKLYFITPNGEVTSTLTPQTLKITLIEGEGENVPRALLQIGSWVYPLIPGVSPCYRTDYGAFILPNVYSEIQGASIGIILPPDTDADVYELLENILYGIVGKPKDAKELPSGVPELSQKISSGIVDGAWFVSQGLVRTAEAVGGLISSSTPKLISHIKQSEQPTAIPRKVSKSMQITETATNKAAQITGYVANQVGAATVKLGQFLAPHIEKQGTRLLTSKFHMTEADASIRVRGVLMVAAGAVEGFSTVYRGLENSATILAHSLKENTVKVVQHKYGHPAGEFADDTLNTVGNVIYIGRNARIIQPKRLVKHTAKEAGKALVYEYRVNDGASTSRQNNIAENTSKDLEHFKDKN